MNYIPMGQFGQVHEGLHKKHRHGMKGIQDPEP